MTDDLLWPGYPTADDLSTIEAVPLAKRGLPESTYALLTRAAARWPDRTAISVLPDAARWREPEQRTFADPEIAAMRPVLKRLLRDQMIAEIAAGQR